MPASLHAGFAARLRRILLAVCLIGACASSLYAAESDFATLEAVGGQVVVLRQGQPREATRGMGLERNDVIVTKQGRATVVLRSDGLVIRVGPDSRVAVDESGAQRDITLFFGRLWAHVTRARENPTRFTTGGTIAAVRGTELTLAVATDGDQTQLAVIEGNVLAQNDKGSVEVGAGQAAIASKGTAPALTGIQVRPGDAVQWALFYFPVLKYAPDSIVGNAPWQAQWRQSVEAWRRGDLATAFSSFDGVSDADVTDPRFFNYRAQLFLSAGNVSQAAQDLERAEKLAPGNAESLALQSVVAVARNQNDQALALADRAVAADPNSATALIALSWAQQSLFNLEGARASLQKAVQVDPNNALAWARLAEIESSFGRLDASLEAAQKAAALEPNVSRTQTVLGFAYLLRINNAESKAAFDKAIALDPSDPLPRLGLGLAQIRFGNLPGGTEQIEVAVSLDPGGSILRSYLGKAYFEQKRSELASREYQLAKQLDPNDPTPWFYDAILLQTLNRPVEALVSYERAITLNDDRAVYRSRLLLDSDLAARQAAIGRVYTDLGFQARALVEGWTSVNTDPSNYSGHRLLADMYASIPRREIARVSELYQSQMLQPLNVTPLQPRLATTNNLLLLAAQGPSATSFSEFNPLFVGNQLTAQGNLLAGSNTTLGGDAILSGIYDRVSFSLGYSGFRTDGFRPNNVQEDQIGAAFVQAQLGVATSVQAEVRRRRLDAGDLSLNFFENDYNPLLKRNEQGTSSRFGIRHDFGPSLTVLGSYQRGTLSTNALDPRAATTLDLDTSQSANSVEGQAIYRSTWVRVVAGAGFFGINTDQTANLTVVRPSLTSANALDTTQKQTNVYAYSFFPLPYNFTLVLGASGNFFDESGSSTSQTTIAGRPPSPPRNNLAAVLGTQNQFNPKVGLLWALPTGTTLRAAWFKTFTRTLITGQTLEPTQVAGFTQFYDEPRATKANVWGVGVDQKLTSKVFAGVEYVHRDLDIPVTRLTAGPQPSVDLRFVEGSEALARAYLYAAPFNWVAVGAEYQYEKLERPPQLLAKFNTVTTQRVPLTARFFHPSGFSGFVGVTYFNQEGDFVRTSAAGQSVFVPGERNFWVLDAALRYRLPNRAGFLTFGVNNLTDQKATYQATDPNNLLIRPGRFVFGQLVLSF